MRAEFDDVPIPIIVGGLIIIGGLAAYGAFKLFQPAKAAIQEMINKYLTKEEELKEAA